MDKMSYYCSHV